MTHQQAFFLVSGIIFGVVALLHALPLAFHWQVRLRLAGDPHVVLGVGFIADCRAVFLGVLAPSVMARFVITGI